MSAAKILSQTTLRKIQQRLALQEIRGANDVPYLAISEIDAASLVRRDQLHRQALFNPEVDPVWSQVGRLVGLEVSDRIRKILQNQTVES